MSVFISHNREDREKADQLSALVAASGVKTYYETGDIYGQKGWPLKVGERIASAPYFVLIWSERAALSHIIEFEWNIARLMRRNMLVWRLDETKMPELLEKSAAVFEEDLQGISDAARNASSDESKPKDQAAVAEIVKKLHRFNETKPAQVTRKMRIVFFKSRIANPTF